MSKEISILVAGKDDIRRALLLRILPSEGYRVFDLKDPSYVITNSKTDKFSVIVIDLIGINRDPCAIVREIRKTSPQTFIIVICGMEVTYTSQLEPLVNVLLQGPIDPERIQKIINARLLKKRSTIIAVSGGKGGVGKSVVTANLAAGLASERKKVITVDLDIGGPNLHTFFGIRRLDRGIFEFLAGNNVSFADLATPTCVSNVKIIGNRDDYASGSNRIKYSRKLQLMEGLKQLESDYILLDLGSGTNLDVIDFFFLSDNGIIVSTPEITSILNTYGFIKGVLYRKMETYFNENGKGNLAGVVRKLSDSAIDTPARHIGELEKELIKTDSEAEAMLRKIKENFRPGLILNMVRKGSEEKMGNSIKTIVKRYIDVDVDYYGYINRDSSVEASIVNMAPFFINSPDSPASICFKTILSKIKFR